MTQLRNLKDVRLRILNAPIETAALIEDWFGHLGCVVDHQNMEILAGHEDIARIQIETYLPNAVVVDLPLNTPLDLWRLQDVIESLSARHLARADAHLPQRCVARAGRQARGLNG